MTFRTLIRRNLRFHWRAHLGVVLGAAVGSAALIGALVVGDSVRGSLRDRALERLGNIQYALAPGDRLFRDELAKDIKSFFNSRQQRIFVEGGEFGAALMLQATVVSADGASHANHVQLIGVDDGFATMAADDRFRKLPPDAVLLNAPLASQLGVREGDEVVFRVRKPSGLTSEVAISPRSDATFALRLRVHQVVPTEALGNFTLSASQIAPHNAFVSLAMLQEMAAIPHRANLILMERAMVQIHVSREISKVEFMLRDAYGRLFKKDSGVSIHFASSNSNVTYYVLGRNEEVHPFENWSHWIWTDRSFLAGVTTMVWHLQDTELDLRALPDANAVELRTSRVFLDPAAVTAVSSPPIPWLITVNLRTTASPERFGFTGLSTSVLTNWAAMVNSNAQPILTYLATLLAAGTNATPYSMVTAAGAPWTPADLRDDEIVVSQWLADDLRVKPGDEIALSYFLPESGARLEEGTNRFRVRAIVPMEMPWADRTLMPDFPGIEKAESTREWDAGFPLTYKVRPKDDDYWKQHRGTPKAFITLAAGQKMWGNRFGNLTAIRFPIPTNATSALTPALSPGERENRPQLQREPKTADSSTGLEKPKDDQRLSPLPGGEGQGEGERKTLTAEAYHAALEKKILANLKPEELGLRFEPVREQALKAAAESQDFGGLFLGFSFFVIGAALLLMALLFSLGLEQRAPEIGTLLALGFTPKQVRSLLLREGVALAFLGGVLGALGGLAYAKAMLHGLTTIWRDAVGASALSFHFTAQTLIIGLFSSVVVSVVTIWLTLRKFVKRPARELLVGEIDPTESNVQSLKSKVIAVGALLAGVALAGWAVVKGDTANAGAFFGVGALVLVAGLSFVSAWLARRTGVAPVSNLNSSSDRDRRDACPTLASLGVRGCARRRKRSLATVAMLACGSFLIVSIGVFRLDANRDATKRSSGTGGFALIGETTMPVVQDLNSRAGREFFALNEADLNGVSFVPFRVREGDEASCLNLNRAQKPRLLGVKPEMLEGRFTFAKTADGALPERPWFTLKRGEFYPKSGQPLAKDEVAAIGDANSIQWAMHKKVGDTIDYVDERGQPFKVRIVGAVANSILQGQLIIDEAEFVKRFPGESGYRMFLIDAPSNAVSQVSATLSRAMQDVGLELTPAAQRLAQFNAVQNTYLGTFQVLGGLGLLLGSVGLGIVVLRNVLERRGELAVLMAVGFRKRTLQRLLLIENGALLVVGLALGMIAAAVAVLPALFSASAPLPYASLAITLAAVLVNGALWTWAATRVALRGDLLAALRNE